MAFKWHSYVILTLLTGCGTVRTQLVDHPYPVEIKTEVTVAVPEALSKDCPPDPLASTRVGDTINRLASVELALAQCRHQLAQIRALPVGETNPPSPKDRPATASP